MQSRVKMVIQGALLFANTWLIVGIESSPDEAFSVYYQVPFYLPRPVKFRTLCTVEAVRMHILKPLLCIQKQISDRLSLASPDIPVARP